MQNKDSDFFCIYSPEIQAALGYELLTGITAVLKFLHVSVGLISQTVMPSLRNTVFSHLLIRY